MAQMTHPDIIALPEEFEKIQALEPVYPLTGGLTNRHAEQDHEASALALVAGAARMDSMPHTSPRKAGKAGRPSLAARRTG